VSDKHRSISAFAKSKRMEHINFKSSKHTAGGEYHVQNVNNIASGMKSFVNQWLRGFQQNTFRVTPIGISPAQKEYDWQMCPKKQTYMRYMLTVKVSTSDLSKTTRG